MAKIKVLQLSSERSWRGGEQQLAYLIDALNALDDVEVVIAARKNSSFAEWAKKRGLRVYLLPFINGLDMATAWQIKQISKELNVDLVHVHSGKAHSLAHFANLMGMNKPLIVHRRVDFDLSTSQLKLSKYNHHSVRRILCVSNAIANIVKQAVQHPDKVSTVYDGVDFSRFNRTIRSGFLHRELGIDATKRLVVNVSALAPHKDYPTFIRTAARTLESRGDVHFIAVGSGDQEAKLQYLTKSLGIEAHFTFAGFRNDIPEVLQEADVFMMTSKTEGLGSSIIDAMHCGLPVVATRAGGIPELVVDGTTGFLSDPGDFVGLSSQLCKLLDSNELMKYMGEGAKRMSMLFSVDNMAAKVVQAYREALG